MTRFKLLDRTALICVIALALIGVLLVYSATLDQDGLSGLWLKQLVWISGGLTAYLILSQWDYHTILDHAGLLYILGIMGLVLVLIFGAEINGAKSWFRLPFMSIQPSEFVKFTTILFVVKYFSRFQDRQSSLMELVGSGFLVGVPFILVVLQPDFGTAFLYMPFFLVPNFLSGNKGILWVTGLGSFMVVVLVALVIFKPDVVFILKDYQKDRIAAFVFPDQDVSNRGYQVHQAKISIGNGGLLGEGIGKGKQTHFGFLPAQHNDFILAVAAEETGFIGVLLIFSLYLLLFIRSCSSALNACDGTGSILVLLVLSTLILQMLYNAGMMIGFVPTTGIPCPLLSYGGSSALSSFAMLGLIQSVHTHRYVN